MNVKIIGVIIKLAVAKDSLEKPFLNNITLAPSLLGPIPNVQKNIKNRNFLKRGFCLNYDLFKILLLLLLLLPKAKKYPPNFSQ